MRTYYLSFLIVFSALVPAFTQTSSTQPNQSNCLLTISPAIRGIRLGMTAEEVLALLPPGNESQLNRRAVALAERPPNFGVARLSLQSSYYPSSAIASFAGVNSISITLLDKQVVDLGVSYSGPNSNPRGPAWNSIDDFITKIMRTLLSMETAS
jgi:hypothetical protein